MAAPGGGVWRDPTPPSPLGQRHADYAYRLAVDPQPAKELRLFGLASWAVDRFIERRRLLFDLQYRATRLREKSIVWCLLIVLAANLLVFGALGAKAANGSLPLDRLVVFAMVAMGVSQIAFGGLNWALDGAAAPVVAVERLGPAMAPLGDLRRGPAVRRTACHLLAIRGCRFAIQRSADLRQLDLTVPTGIAGHC